MSVVSRRTFTKGLLASALVPGHSAVGQPNDPASIAIIDTPNNAAKVASKLAAQNVKVVVRFFARKPQPGLREKVMASDGNMIDGVREPTILIRNGLSIVSLYQYRNNLPEKFLKGLEDTGSAKAEVAADAKAALDQAGLVGQPEGSAIYFGVDFNANRAGVDAVLEYFRVVGRTVGNHYAIGVYGNGFVNRILRQEKLVAYNWISASRAHAKPSISTTVDNGIFFKTRLSAAGLDHPANAQPASMSIRTCRTQTYPASARGEQERLTEAETKRFLSSAASRSAQRRSFSKAPTAAAGRSTVKIANPTRACRKMPMSEFLCNPAPGPVWTSTKMVTPTAK
jgi:hypothetical protein